MLTLRPHPQLWSRRWLLARLAAVPAVAATSKIAWAETETAAPSLEQMLNVMDFEPVARAALPPAHWGYIATGVDDDRTVAINHEAFSRVEIRSRRFVDVSHVDLSVKMFGVAHPSPVYMSAVSRQRAFNPAEGELGTARAARTHSTLMLLSNVSTTSVEDVSEARGDPVWMQLYATDDWEVTKGVVKRAERAGCPAIALTVDNMPGRNNETLLRSMREDKRVCTSCHVDNSHNPLRQHSPMYEGLDVSRVKELSHPRVLAIDDDHDLLTTLISTLGAADMLASGIALPSDAFALLRDKKFDLILLDIALPEESGIDLCPKIRALPGYEKTPVVFVTARDTVDNRTQSTVGGGNDFITKPFNTLELTLKAQIWIYRKQFGLL